MRDKVEVRTTSDCPENKISVEKKFPPIIFRRWEFQRLNRPQKTEPDAGWD